MSDALVAIVTGGAQGLGAAVCSLLLKEGYRVCVADINEVNGQRFTKEQQKIYGASKIKFQLVDVAVEESFKGVFDFVLKEFNRVDVLVNNAGVNMPNVKEKIIEINLLGTLHGCMIALQFMGKSNGGQGGAVINVSSLAGFIHYPTNPVYGATKFGILGLTKSYGVPSSFARDGVMFAAICPSTINTQLARGIISKRPVLQREPELLMEPEYVARGVLKLLEDKINGSAMVVSSLDGFKYIGGHPEVENLKIVKKLLEP